MKEKDVLRKRTLLKEIPTNQKTSTSCSWVDLKYTMNPSLTFEDSDYNIALSQVQVGKPHHRGEFVATWLILLFRSSGPSMSSAVKMLPSERLMWAISRPGLLFCQTSFLVATSGQCRLHFFLLRRHGDSLCHRDIQIRYTTGVDWPKEAYVFPFPIAKAILSFHRSFMGQPKTVSFWAKKKKRKKKPKDRFLPGMAAGLGTAEEFTNWGPKLSSAQPVFDRGPPGKNLWAVVIDISARALVISQNTGGHSCTRTDKIKTVRTLPFPTTAIGRVARANRTIKAFFFFSLGTIFPY